MLEYDPPFYPPSKVARSVTFYSWREGIATTVSVLCSGAARSCWSSVKASGIVVAAWELFGAIEAAFVGI